LVRVQAYPPFYGRGTLVVQQSPKLPYGGAIPSVRANFFCVYADRYIRRLR
jgi:hypothetical protein